jgi:hypothetical protein
MAAARIIDVTSFEIVVERLGSALRRMMRPRGAA